MGKYYRKEINNFKKFYSKYILVKDKVSDKYISLVLNSAQVKLIKVLFKSKK
jgi:hypothetical protein